MRSTNPSTPSPMASFKLFFFIFSILLSFATTKAQNLNYRRQICSKYKFTANTSYQANLRTLLSSLSSKAINHNTEYNNNTVPNNKTLSSSDTVYGMFMCRGDIPSPICTECVGNATQRLSTNAECTWSKAAVMWYDECMVRYSNESFFSRVTDAPGDPGYALASPNRIYQASFNRTLFETLNKTADEAAKPAIGLKKFATHEADLPPFEKLYCLAQCTPDLSPQDCRSCLDGLINSDLPRCCAGREGGRVLYPNCNIRFEIYPFYRLTASAPTATPAIRPSNSAEYGWKQVVGFFKIIYAISSFNSIYFAVGYRRTENKKSRSRTIILIVVPAVVMVMLFTFCFYLLRRRARMSYKTILVRENFGHESTTLEGLQFDLDIIEAATNNFSHENMIGKGGFGKVYKGILLDGRHIAVKRLCMSSRQGANEFKNEILLIAKLQHRNLVAFIGFCLEEQEKILIYEYVPNGSLDYFLFGDQQHKLSWTERYKIVRGIALGILYLHEYSRLKVIHRDLKPSNILLDEDMNPKISDFGMARIIEINQHKGETNRVVGTYGYMSPEYAMLGRFSEKSDIFSFGVMVLEIIVGKKNAHFYESQHLGEGLLSYVWRQWKDETPFRILDPIMKDYLEVEVMKCIQIGLLCVQENPDARPTMATIVSGLNNLSLELPSPGEPAFLLNNNGSSSSQSAKSSTLFSVNEMSMSTSFRPR